MDGIQMSDLIHKEDGWYVSHETLMKKAPEYALKVVKVFNSTVSPSIPYSPGLLYKVENPEEFIKAQNE